MDIVCVCVCLSAARSLALPANMNFFKRCRFFVLDSSISSSSLPLFIMPFYSLLLLAFRLFHINRIKYSNNEPIRKRIKRERERKIEMKLTENEKCGSAIKWHGKKSPAHFLFSNFLPINMYDIYDDTLHILNIWININE